MYCISIQGTSLGQRQKRKQCSYCLIYRKYPYIREYKHNLGKIQERKGVHIVYISKYLWAKTKNKNSVLAIYRNIPKFWAKYIKRKRDVSNTIYKPRQNTKIPYIQGNSNQSGQNKEKKGIIPYIYKKPPIEKQLYIYKESGQSIKKEGVPLYIGILSEG